MGILLIDRALQSNAAAWKSNKSADVNDPPSDYFEAMQGPKSSMVVTNGYAGTKQYAGALIANKRQLPYYNGKLLPYVQLVFGFMWNAWAYENIARHELDLKVCTKTRPDPNTPIRNVANFSTQWNRDSGQFQIDQDPPGWTDTGLIVKEIAPEIWHRLDYRFWFDPAACIFSVLSIELDGQLYTIPDKLQNVPMQTTNWEEIAAIQIQNEMFHTGSTAIGYNQIDLTWSDEPLAKRV